MRSVIDSRVCGAEHYLDSYVSVRKYKQMKIATELHRPTWVSLPLVDAILRDDVLISFITPPEFQTEPISPSRGRIFTVHCNFIASIGICGSLLTFGSSLTWTFARLRKKFISLSWLVT